MNCDQAFDVLTGPRRASDQELLVHLSGCPRCREMQATLEPALGLFPAGSAASRNMNPGEDETEETEVATQSARRLTATVPAPRRSEIGLWGYAAAVMLGAGLVWGTLALTPSTSKIPSAHGSQSDCLYLADVRPTGMTSRQMTQSCLACHAVTERP